MKVLMMYYCARVPDLQTKVLAITVSDRSHIGRTARARSPLMQPRGMRILQAPCNVFQ